MLIGTAGHIDHGKTALIKALTGVDADRLKEEKARGITIDLGYAYQPLASGAVLGFIDVPGHERFVHNMLAGATGIDFALLVVAADDGVMPQTREHLAILDLLGVNAGAVALTKIDRVEPARVDEVRAEIAALLRDTPLATAPVFPVSNFTGEGVDALRAHLELAAAQTQAHASDGQFRLAVDRCFTLSGSGTVVTGTVFAGSVAVGDRLRVSPAGHEVRVRSIHAQNRPAERGVAGERCALNLAGIEKGAIARGDWIVAAALHAPSARFDVQLRVLASESATAPSLGSGILRRSTSSIPGVVARGPRLDPIGEKPLKHWQPVHVHLGAIDRLGHVSLLEGVALAAGASGYAQIVLDQPVGVLHGDRVILRDQAAARTLAGGVVLDPFAPARKTRTPERLQALQALAASTPQAALTALLDAQPQGVALDAFTRAWNLNAATVDQLARELALTRVATADGAAFCFSAAHWTQLRQTLTTALAAEHRRAPEQLGLEARALRRAAVPLLAWDLYAVLLDQALHAGEVVKTGPWLHLPTHRVRLTEADEALWSRAQPLFKATPFEPPWVRDLARGLKVEEDRMRTLLKRVTTLGETYEVVKDRFFTRAAMTQLTQIAADLAATHGAVRAAEFRDRLGCGRKLAIQILEYFDKTGFSRRVGDDHRLRDLTLLAGGAKAQTVHPCTAPLASIPSAKA